MEYNFYKSSFNGGDDLGYVGLWHEIEQAEPLWLLDFICFAIEIMPEHPIVERIINRAKDWNFNHAIHKKFFAICKILTETRDYARLYSLSNFLYALNNINFYRENLEKYTDWIQIAERIVNLNEDQKSFISGDVTDFELSFNSTNGSLARFVIQLYGLSKEEKETQKKCEVFIRVLMSNDAKGYAVINLMNYYSFIKKNNSLFAQKELLPFLLSNHQEIKLQAWRGFFRNAHLEFSEFREINQEFFSILKYALDHNDKKLIRDLTDLYIYSIYFEYHGDAIKSLRKLQRYDNQEISAQILEIVLKILHKETDIEKVWSWLGEYLQDRLYQVNQPLTEHEISRIWYLLTHYLNMIVKLKDIVLELPFKDEWIRFLHDLSRNHIVDNQSLWCEVLGFYLDNQDD